MKNCSILFTALALLVFFSGCKSSSSDTVELKFNLPPGSKYEYSATTGMNMKQEFNGKEMDIKNEAGFTYLFEAKNDSANWKTLSTTITRISMDMSGMGGTMHFDSDMASDTATGPFAIFSALKGSTFSFAINDKGEIGKISGLNELRQKMLSGFPHAAEATEDMKNGIEDENLRQNMQQAFSVYPGKPVKPGDSWTKTNTESMKGMNLTMENTYTLQSVKGDDVEIKQVSKFVSDSSTNSSQRGVNVTGNSTGSMHYDLKTGMITSGDVDMMMNINRVMMGGKPLTMNMKMRMKGKKVS